MGEFNKVLLLLLLLVLVLVLAVALIDFAQRDCTARKLHNLMVDVNPLICDFFKN